MTTTPTDADIGAKKMREPTDIERKIAKDFWGGLRLKSKPYIAKGHRIRKLLENEK